MEKEVCGEFPEFCCKVFDCKKYAEDFIYSGTFRMGGLLSYREIEDELRRDSTEGIGRTKEPGIVTYYGFTQNLKEKPAIVQKSGYQEHHIEQGNKVYCFCTCLPEVNHAHMLERFGKYIVKINEPKRLAEDINDYFISKGQKILIEGCKVVYNKGQKLDRKLRDNERLDLSYRQKEFKKFHKDCEFRIVAIKLGDLCKEECEFLGGQFERVESECRFIVVNLGKQLNYAQFCES